MPKLHGLAWSIVKCIYGWWLKIISLGEYVAIACYTDASLIFFLLEKLQFWKSWFVFIYICNDSLHETCSDYSNPHLSLFLWIKYSIKLYIVVNLHYLSCDCLISPMDREPLMTESRPYVSTLFLVVRGTLLGEVQGKCSSSIRNLSSQKKLVNEATSL